MTILFVLAVLLYGPFIANILTARSSDAAGRGMSLGFAVIQGLVLWIVLAFTGVMIWWGVEFTRFGWNQTSELADLPIEWHLIGHLQRNKTREVAEAFDWVHSVDRLKIAQRLAEQRPTQLPPLQLCLQVNISGEASKSGLQPGEVQAVAQAVAALPAERVRLRGLMAIPEPVEDAAAQRRPHRALHELLTALNASGLALDTLSMGMSADLEAAVAEGATLVRVGTAIFGVRDVSRP